MAFHFNGSVQRNANPFLLYMDGEYVVLMAKRIGVVKSAESRPVMLFGILLGSSHFSVFFSPKTYDFLKKAKGSGLFRGNGMVL